MSRTTPLILPHGSGNLPLFSLTVQGICQNISMWRTEHGKNTPISNKVMAHSSSHTNQIHSNSGARANTHHNALSGVHMAQPPHFNDVELCSKATFLSLEEITLHLYLPVWHLFYFTQSYGFHFASIFIISMFAPTHTKPTVIQYFCVSVNLSIHISGDSRSRREKKVKKFRTLIFYDLLHLLSWCVKSCDVEILHCHVNACKTMKLIYCLTTWASYIFLTVELFVRSGSHSYHGSFLEINWLLVRSYYLS